MTDTVTLITIAARCLAIGVLVRSIELLANWREMRAGLLAPLIPVGAAAARRRVEHALSSEWVAGGVLLVRTGAALACLWLPFSAPTFPYALGILVVAQLYCNARFRGIAQGADVMFVIGLAAVLVGSLDPTDPQLRDVALTFLGVQALVAYAAAGIDKLRSPAWRDGRRLTQVFEQTMVRFEPLGRALVAHPGVARVASGSIIALELSLPFSVFLPTTLFYAVLATGLAFHLSIALLMGLHGFFWSFGAAYPAIYFVHHALRARWPA